MPASCTRHIALRATPWRIDPPAAPQQSTPGQRIVRRQDRAVFDLDPGTGAGSAQRAPAVLGVQAEQKRSS